MCNCVDYGVTRIAMATFFSRVMFVLSIRLKEILVGWLDGIVIIVTMFRAFDADLN